MDQDVLDIQYMKISERKQILQILNQLYIHSMIHPISKSKCSFCINWHTLKAHATIGNTWCAWSFVHFFIDGILWKLDTTSWAFCTSTYGRLTNVRWKHKEELLIGSKFADLFGSHRHAWLIMVIKYRFIYMKYQWIIFWYWVSQSLPHICVDVRYTKVDAVHICG